MIYSLTRISRNKKTGPIPVSTSSAITCPDACPLKKNGCYADSGPLNIHWRKVTEGKRGMNLEDFCNELRKLPKKTLFRHNQAGDLMGENNKIDAKDFRLFLKAVKHLRGFTYTHKPVGKGYEENLKLIKEANDSGFTVNLSADNLDEADELADTGLPTVTILPEDYGKNGLTPKGKRVITCPTYYKEGIDCAHCQLCAKPKRNFIVGFPVHGKSKKKAEKVFHAKQ